jgi:FAD:protein FMN transferase
MRKIIVLCVLLGLAVWGTTFMIKGDPWQRQARYLLGTTCEITLYSTDRETRNRAFHAAFNAIGHIHSYLNVFSDSSDLSVLNNTAFISPVPVSADLLYVLQKSKEIAILTDGAFDVTTLPLFKLWGFYSSDYTVPKKDDIVKTLDLVDYRNIKITPSADSGKARVSFMVDGMAIDFGGIAKGYACDQARRALEENGIQNALINIGGTIYAMGHGKSEDAWRIGIRDPRDHVHIKRVIALSERAVSTSGDYEQYFMHEGKRYGHILDPRSGYPVEHTVAVTVIAPSGLMADGLSTGLFVLGAEKGAALVARMQDVEAVMYTYRNGTIKETLSPQFSEFIEITK